MNVACKRARARERERERERERAVVGNKVRTQRAEVRGRADLTHTICPLVSHGCSHAQGKHNSTCLSRGYYETIKRFMDRVNASSEAVSLAAAAAAPGNRTSETGVRRNEAAPTRVRTMPPSRSERDARELM